MKIKRICFVAALALGVAVAWVGSAPSSADAEGLVGGWVPIGDSCCDGEHIEDCSNGQPCYPGPDTLVCEPDPNGRDECNVLPSNACTGALVCTSTADTECS